MLQTYESLCEEYGLIPERGARRATVTERDGGLAHRGKHRARTRPRRSRRGRDGARARGSDSGRDPAGRRRPRDGAGRRRHHNWTADGLGDSDDAAVIGRCLAVGGRLRVGVSVGVSVGRRVGVRVGLALTLRVATRDGRGLRDRREVGDRARDDGRVRLRDDDERRARRGRSREGGRRRRQRGREAGETGEA